MTIGVLALPWMGGSSAMAEPNLDLYRRFVDAEVQIPLPAATASVDMGVLLADGGFDGLTTLRNSHGAATIHPEVRISGRSAALTFEIANPDPQAFAEIQAGRRSTLAPGQTRLIVQTRDLRPGERAEFRWSLSSDRRSARDTIVVIREFPFAVGAFTIPVLPIGVIYEPPQIEGALRNAASYATEHRIETSHRWSSSSSDIRVSFESALTLRDAISSLAPLAAKIPAVGGALAGAMGAIASGLGSTATQQGTSLASYGSHAITLRASMSTSYMPATAAGPGVGDIFLFLTEVQVGWVLREGRLMFTVLGYRGPDPRPVAWVRAQAESARSPYREAWQNLLSFDPFAVGGRLARLDPPRFRPIQTGLPVDQAIVNFAVTSEQIRGSTRGAQNSMMTFTQVRSGWLSAVGIGPRRNEDLSTTVTSSSERGESASTTHVASIQLNPSSRGAYVVDLYLDTLFNTIAVRMHTVQVPGGRAPDLRRSDPR